MCSAGNDAGDRGMGKMFSHSSNDSVSLFVCALFTPDGFARFAEAGRP